MLECPKCKECFSESVYPHHIARCDELAAEAKREESADGELEALREQAAALGIENYQKKKAATLRKEIAALELQNLRLLAEAKQIEGYADMDAGALTAALAALEEQ
jgi:hypothetical protein